ncbi:hypothetical protein D3C80_1960110 [compost metagenome]
MRMQRVKQRLLPQTVAAEFHEPAEILLTQAVLRQFTKQRPGQFQRGGFQRHDLRIIHKLRTACLQ